MFGLFKKADPGVKVIDRIWISKQGKWKACEDMQKVDPACLFVAWFPETLEELKSAVSQDGNVLLADDLTSSNMTDKRVIFVEHYPLASVEQDLFKRLDLKEVPVLSGLDEPLFLLFNGEKTIQLMKKMGMKDDEAVGNSMLSKSIKRAQEAIAEKVKVDSEATSQQSWIAKHLNR